MRKLKSMTIVKFSQKFLYSATFELSNFVFFGICLSLVSNKSTLVTTLYIYPILRLVLDFGGNYLIYLRYLEISHDLSRVFSNIIVIRLLVFASGISIFFSLYAEPDIEFTSIAMIMSVLTVFAAPWLLLKPETAIRFLILNLCLKLFCVFVILFFSLSDVEIILITSVGYFSNSLVYFVLFDRSIFREMRNVSIASLISSAKLQSVVFSSRNISGLVYANFNLCFIEFAPAQRLESYILAERIATGLKIMIGILTNVVIGTYGSLWRYKKKIDFIVLLLLVMQVGIFLFDEYEYAYVFVIALMALVGSMSQLLGKELLLHKKGKRFFAISVVMPGLITWGALNNQFGLVFEVLYVVVAYESAVFILRRSFLSLKG